MNNLERAIKCGRVAHDILTGNFVMKRTVSAVTVMQMSENFYDTIIVDGFSYGIFSRKLGVKITTIPEFLVVYDNGNFTPFEYLTIHFISKYTTIIDGNPILLPPPKIYMKEKKAYTVKGLIQYIKERFSK